MADREQIQYPPQASVTQDRGFQGYAPDGVHIYQAHKKPRGKALTLAERVLNRVIAQVRMGVEHVIASIKRGRIVKDVLRNTKAGFSDLAMSVACALHNWRLCFRKPVRASQPLGDYFR